MTTKDDGGPAFPVQSLDSEYRNGLYHDVWRPVGGMSLRDYFAGQALGLGGEWFHNNGVEQERAIATACYCIADSMLKARKV